MKHKLIMTQIGLAISFLQPWVGQAALSESQQKAQQEIVQNRLIASNDRLQSLRSGLWLGNLNFKLDGQFAEFQLKPEYSFPGVYGLIDTVNSSEMPVPFWLTLNGNLKESGFSLMLSINDQTKTMSGPLDFSQQITTDYSRSMQMMIYSDANVSQIDWNHNVNVSFSGSYLMATDAASQIGIKGSLQGERVAKQSFDETKSILLSQGIEINQDIKELIKCTSVATAASGEVYSTSGLICLNETQMRAAFDPNYKTAPKVSACSNFNAQFRISSSDAQMTVLSWSLAQPMVKRGGFPPPNCAL